MSMFLFDYAMTPTQLVSRLEIVRLGWLKGYRWRIFGSQEVEEDLEKL